MGAVADWVFFPLELAYRGGVSLRNRLYDAGILRARRARLPVVSVGNLTVGGTGKTPFSAWLAGELEKRGHVPAVVTRGFGRDEVELHRRWAPLRTVIVDRDRGRGAWRAASLGATVVVLDDGFQHRRLARDLDVVLVPAGLAGKVRLLPRGPFREPLEAARRAGVLAITLKGAGEDPEPAKARLARLVADPPLVVRFLAAGWTDLWGNPSDPPQGPCLGVAGVGDPDGFQKLVEKEVGSPVPLLAFPDHYPYTDRDAAGMRALAGYRTIVTTEKDAVKLVAYADRIGSAAVLRLKVVVEEGEDLLWERVTAALERGRGAA